MSCQHSRQSLWANILASPRKTIVQLAIIGVVCLTVSAAEMERPDG